VQIAVPQSDAPATVAVVPPPETIQKMKDLLEASARELETILAEGERLSSKAQQLAQRMTDAKVRCLQQVQAYNRQHRLQATADPTAGGF
jgi:aspartokinase